MTNIISIITAVHEPSIRYLPEAYGSIVSQEMPDDWSWQWIVQEDGRSGSAAKVLPPDDARISTGTGTKGGPAVTRNMALGRAKGNIVRVLDADDKLTPGALARDIAVLHDQSIGWTTSRVLDLLPDGSTTGWEHADPPAGRLVQGKVLTYFRENNYRLPVHPATLSIRRKLVLALGGWMALPGGEDTGLLVAASATNDGFFIATPGLLYRKHPAQITGQASWKEPTEWTARMQLIEARGQALQTMNATQVQAV